MNAPWTAREWDEHNRKLTEALDELRRLDAEEAVLHRSMIADLKQAFGL